MLTHFGSKCIQCGFEDWRGLQIDHIDGGGRKFFHLTAHYAYAYYRELLKAEPGIDYQLLCANCNQIKKYENHEVYSKTQPSRMARKLLEKVTKKLSK